MNKINFKIPLFAILALICTISISCKTSDNTNTTKSDEAVKDTVAQSDLNETQEDLLTVDYKQFYDELAPHGEWIEVTSADLKSEEQPTSAGEEEDELNQLLKDRSASFPKVTFGQLFGVNDAVAADVNVGTFFVWRPDPSMAVSIVNGDPSLTIGTPAVPPAVVVAPVYRPYTNGQWIATDEGWYFKAPTPQEEIVHHYGRWAYSPTMGYVWVPGRVRSPAWVDWREDEDNIAWTPIPPDVYVVNNIVQPVPVYEDRYVVVEKRYFIEPVVTQYVYVDKIKVKKMKHLKGLYVRDRVLVNSGPEYTVIERFTGRTITPYKVVTINNGFRNTWIENNRVNTFAPVFTKVKGNKNRTMVVTHPEKFNKFQEVWNRENNNKSAGKNKIEDIGKEYKDDDKYDKQKESKELKQNKQDEKRKKVFDDSDMKNGKKKEKKDDNGNDNGNKEKKEKQRKEVKEKKDNQNKDPKREDSPDRKKDKKEKKDSK
jgi:hypothetical protein